MVTIAFNQKITIVWSKKGGGQKMEGGGWAGHNCDHKYLENISDGISDTTPALRAEKKCVWVAKTTMKKTISSFYAAITHQDPVSSNQHQLVAHTVHHS